MRIFERLEDFALTTKHPLVLTIGNFDGMHRGHRAVLQKARALAGEEGEIAVITFSNHPSTILKPDLTVRLLCTLPHRIHLLEQFSIDTLLLLAFTPYIAQHSASSFLERVRCQLPFSHLVMGHDATLGRDRQGNRLVIGALADEWGFTVHYLDAYRFEGQPISSTKIRDYIQQGNLEGAEELLNRPYSIYCPYLEGSLQGNTLKFAVDGLCLPPPGVYAITLKMPNQELSGEAYLTTQSLSPPALIEVRLTTTGPIQERANQNLEIVFRHFIRPLD